MTLLEFFKNFVQFLEKSKHLGNFFWRNPKFVGKFLENSICVALLALKSVVLRNFVLGF